MAEGVGCKGAISLLGHQDNGIQYSGNGGGSEHGAPDDTVRGCKVVGKNGWRVRIGRYTGYIQDPPRAFVGFPECGRASTEPAALASPVEGIEASTRTPPTTDPRGKVLVTCLDAMG